MAFSPNSTRPPGRKQKPFPTACSTNTRPSWMAIPPTRYMKVRPSCVNMIMRSSIGVPAQLQPEV